MRLELDGREVEELRLALQAQQARLLAELARADHRAFREMLKEKVEVLEQVAARLETVTQLGDRERTKLLGLSGP